MIELPSFHPTYQKLNHSMRTINQHKAINRIKKNAALEQLSGDYKSMPNLQKTNEQIDRASHLGGDDLRDYINELKMDARHHNWYNLARTNYKTGKKEYSQLRKQEAKKNGFFSSAHFVAWVKTKVLKNLAKKAGVTGFRYRFKKYFYGKEKV